MKAIIFIALTIFPITSYAAGTSNGSDKFADLMKTTKEVVDPMPEKLKAVLLTELTTNGAIKAIEVCSVKAPAMAKAASEKTGWKIKRVSLKNRNPNGKADEWEATAIKGFEQELAANTNATMEKGEIVTINNQQYFRYAKGLKTSKECMLCHGSNVTITTELQEKLKAIYPNDLATGYDVNQVRGILSVTRPVQ